MTTTSPSSDVPDTGAAARAFKPGPGFYVLVCLIVLTVVLALSAAITSALGVTGPSRLLGGTALILVGLGMLASLRVSARSLVVNAPRLRLERNRVRAAQARQQAESTKSSKKAAGAAGGKSARGKAGRGSQSSQRGSGADDAAAAQPGGELATLTVPGTKVLVPESTGRRELTTLDVVSGPVTTALAATSVGRAADEHLAGTSTGETLIRVGQLLLGATGFVLVALGLASILGQVIS
ncbi:hypothetical protein E4J66_13435 [Actinomyces viscosus]|uniref:Uncharacterized protein n=1 Tax=Actinomyces viscosus TaxID=1656 RepID=A0A448PLX4_ACTVI|nr:hypothetical protein [Actinomyces viscosus]TFH51023.1 hypothetical protein E4J66_13435 [Actinomyces viscosus]VEI16721.1 Uncharacterised protein [Actinomyces viscosus]